MKLILAFPVPLCYATIRGPSKTAANAKPNGKQTIFVFDPVWPAEEPPVTVAVAEGLLFLLQPRDTSGQGLFRFFRASAAERQIFR
jgi:hypothetical protein